MIQADPIYPPLPQLKHHARTLKRGLGRIVASSSLKELLARLCAILGLSLHADNAASLCGFCMPMGGIYWGSAALPHQSELFVKCGSEFLLIRNAGWLCATVDIVRFLTLCDCALVVVVERSARYPPRQSTTSHIAVPKVSFNLESCAFTMPLREVWSS